MRVFLLSLCSWLTMLQTILADSQQIQSCTQVSTSGVYTLNYQGMKANVLCDADTDWGGWTTIINRINDQSTNFNLEWDILAHRGAGSVFGDYLIRLDLLSAITNFEPHELLVELSDGKKTGWAFYSSFNITSEEENFMLTISGYDEDSTAGDSLNYSNMTFFSAINRDNDRAYHKSCARQFHSPGWFDACYWANPLGDYSPTLRSIAWYTFQSNITKTSLYSLSFKIRPRKCALQSTGRKCVDCQPSYKLARSMNSESVVCVPLCNEANPSCAVCTYSLDCKECNSGYNLKEGRCQLIKESFINYISISQNNHNNYFPQGLLLFICSIGIYLISTCCSQPTQENKKPQNNQNIKESQKLNQSQIDKIRKEMETLNRDKSEQNFNCIQRLYKALMINECCFRANSKKQYGTLIPVSILIEVLRVSIGLLLFQIIHWQALLIKASTHGKKKAKSRESVKKELTKEQKQHILSVFNLFQTDRSGSMEVKDLELAFSALRLQYNKVEISKYLREKLKDRQKSGVLQFKEFLDIVSLKMGQTENDEQTKKIFALFSKGKPTLSLEDLKSISAQLGQTLNDEQLNQVLGDLVRKDKRTEITLEQFIVILNKISAASGW